MAAVALLRFGSFDVGWNDIHAIVPTPTPTMGDATIYILIEDTSSSDMRFHQEIAVLAADASIAELMENVSTLLGRYGSSSADLDKATIIDASYNPARLITSQARQFRDKSGPSSRTLQSMGWFPSGKIAILLRNAVRNEDVALNDFLVWQSKALQEEHDVAYSNPDRPETNRHPSGKGVQWVGVGASTSGQTLKPSQIFSAVEARADGDQVEDETLHRNNRSNSKRPSKKQSEAERAKRLDTLLNNLAEGKSKTKKKNAAVSEKVRTMLLKSRSEGNKQLRMEDRFHLEILHLVDLPPEEASGANPVNETSPYKFFSKQTTAGRVASSLASNLGDKRSAEFLVKTSSKSISAGEARYRKLPNTMSLQEAERRRFLRDFDVVLIRIYSLSASEDDRFGPSKCVLDSDSEDEPDADDLSVDLAGSKATKSTAEKVEAATHDDDSSDLLSSEWQRQVKSLIESIDEASEEPNRKKKKVSKQVQNMLIKSKAKGDKSVKQANRVYFRIVVCREVGGVLREETVPSSYRFFSKQKDLEQVITDCCPAGTSARCITRNSATGDFRVLSPLSLRLSEAIDKGVLEDYGIFVIRIES